MNQIPTTSRKGMWINEPLEVVMNGVERGRCSLKKANKSWNILLSSFFDHLNKKTRSRKMGP